MSTEWFISGNPTKYDVVGAFKELNKIDWKQSTNVAVGDIVYIYVSEGDQAVKYKCKVNKVDLPNVEIEDRKFDISGEFDGTYGRYMELELIKELKGNLYKRDAMKKYGFVSPQSPVRVIPQLKEYLDIVQKLQDIQELDADMHDGSYEIVRETINSYASMEDLSKVDYKDLNLVYLMSVGTWKQKIPAKKNTILDSNLPQAEKDRLIEVLDKVWIKAQKYEYQNEEEGRPSIGMFGTGFFTFRGKTDEDSPKKFIQMCIDIRNMEDEEEIFERCSKVLNGQFRGMKAASASMVLHCLKPNVFPIFNSNMGADNIFVYLGAEMKWKTEISSYISNVKIVKKLRDENFAVKNYRIFDMAAWSVGKLKENSDVGNNSYWPSLEEYNPGITSEQWTKFILKDYKEYPSTLEMLFTMLANGGKATCKFLAEVLGESTTAWISRGFNFGRRAAKHYDIKEYIDENDKKTPFATCFIGRYVENNLYEWILREELKEALESKMISELKDEIDRIKKNVNMFSYDKNMILYGPPGTGKTYKTAIYAVAICDGKTIDDVETMPYEMVLERYNELKDKEKRVAFTTFHQSYSYEEFIEGIRPVLEEDNSDLAYTIEPGVFKKFCEITKTSDYFDSKPYVFIIDEINRGNISKIFGELITLIENTKREGAYESASAILPYSGQTFSVPSNVYILGTMNTADRSIALMDTALRRRFQFIEMMPDVEVLRTIGADKIKVASDELDVAKMLECINNRIEYLYDREHTIGHAFFTGLKDNPTIEKLASIFEKSVIPLLQEYFYEDYQKIQLVLGDNAKTNTETKFIVDKNVELKEIFMGSVEDIVDEKEVQYEINADAFKDIVAYKEIAKGL